MTQLRKQTYITILHSDAKADQPYHDQLIVQLSLLQRKGLIEQWSDRKILPGSDCSQAIGQAIRSADILLLLISADFLALDICYQIEMRRALERHRTGVVRIVPIIVRSCDWELSPFVDLQYLPRNAKPIATWGNQDEAFAEIARVLRRIVMQQLPLDLDIVSPPSQPSLPALPGTLITSISLPSKTKWLSSNPFRRIIAVAWPSEGMRLAWACADREDGGMTVRACDATTGRTLLTLWGDHTATWSPDGRRLSLVSGDNKIEVWEVESGKRVLRYEDRSEMAMAWSPDGRLLARVSKNHKLEVWEVESGVLCSEDSRYGVKAIVWSPDGRLLASILGYETVQVWKVDNGKLVLRSEDFCYDGVKAIAWSPDGRLLASILGDNRHVEVWKMGRWRRGRNYGCYGVNAIAWSPDGRLLASASSDKSVQVWEISTGKQILTYPGHLTEVRDVVWSPDGERIASVGDEEVQVWVAPH